MHPRIIYVTFILALSMGRGALAGPQLPVGEESVAAQDQPQAESETQAGAPPQADPNEVKIFDGKSLEGWRIIKKLDFEDHGRIEVKDSAILLERGKPATGISWKGKLPRSNYELTFEGKRIEGDDFWCGLTFPVKDDHCTLILGGWGGQVVGLSNVDGFSAVENETTQAMEFATNQWYRIKLRVTDENIAVWINDLKMVNLDTEGRMFSIWWEQEPVTPLGIVTWKTTGAIRKLKLVKLK